MGIKQCIRKIKKKQKSYKGGRNERKRKETQEIIRKRGNGKGNKDENTEEGKKRKEKAKKSE